MAGRQGAAGRGGAPAELGPPQIAVQDLDQARAALAAAADLGVSVQLRSAADAAAYAGLEYLKALGEAVNHEVLIDCGEDAGLVMAALRIGCKKLVFSGPPEIARKLAEMAEQTGARLLVETTRPGVLVLDPDADAERACRAWLKRGSE